jgi:hypothetical protein
MMDTETLDFIVDGDRISFKPQNQWIETWYGSSLSVTLPRLESAGWRVIATRQLVGLSKTSTLYVLQRQRTKPPDNNA